jgi:hypothetical protein
MVEFAPSSIYSMSQVDFCSPPQVLSVHRPAFHTFNVSDALACPGASSRGVIRRLYACMRTIQGTFLMHLLVFEHLLNM